MSGDGEQYPVTLSAVLIKSLDFPIDSFESHGIVHEIAVTINEVVSDTNEVSFKLKK